jgi:hypothetical protein
LIVPAANPSTSSHQTLIVPFATSSAVISAIETVGEVAPGEREEQKRKLGDRRDRPQPKR